MFSFLKSKEAYIYAIFRIALGFSFLWHGSQKLFNIPPAAHEIPPFILLYIAAPIELVGGLCIMLGLFTRFMAFLSCGLMAVAYWMAHGTQALLPIQNQGELAYIYCFAFLFMTAKGSGAWALDNFFLNRSKKV